MTDVIEGVEGLDGAVVGVFGADGFIGSRVVACLEASGASVRPFVEDLLSAGVDVAGFLDGCSHVIHLAARSGGVGFQSGGDDADVLADNTTMTRRVLDGCVAAGVGRVFLASSGVVYARDAGEVLTEDSATVSPGREPVTGYAWSKLTDEATGQWYAAAHDLEVVAGRFTNVYGPGGPFGTARETVVHALIRKCLEAAPDGEVEVWGDGTAVRNFIYVDDAARGVCTILASGESGSVYNVAATEAVSIAAVAELIAEAGVALAFDPSKPTGPGRRVLDGAALRLLGWCPGVPLDDGVARTKRAWQDAEGVPTRGV